MVMLSSGVDLFFVLSGFLLARSFLRAEQTGRPAPRMADYWRARIRRIGPPFWVVLVVVVLFMTPTFIPEMKVFSWAGLAIFLAHIPILQTMYMPAFGAYPVETPFWTLTIEMLFYLSLPFMVRLFFGKRWILFTPLLGLVALGWLFWVRNGADALVHFENVTINVFPPFDEPAVRFFLSHQFPAFLVDFSIGILAAVVVVSKQFKLAANARFQRATSASAGLIVFLAGCFARRDHVGSRDAFDALRIRQPVELHVRGSTARPRVLLHGDDPLRCRVRHDAARPGPRASTAQGDLLVPRPGILWRSRIFGLPVAPSLFLAAGCGTAAGGSPSHPGPSSHFLKHSPTRATLEIPVSYAF